MYSPLRRNTTVSQTNNNRMQTSTEKEVKSFVHTSAKMYRNRKQFLFKNCPDIRLPCEHWTIWQIGYDTTREKAYWIYRYMFIPVLGPFAVGLFAVGHFAVGHFAVRTLRRKDISPWDISPYDFFAVGHFAVFFAVRRFRRKYFFRVFGSFSHFWLSIRPSSWL